MFCLVFFLDFLQKCMVFDQDDLVWTAKMSLLHKLAKVSVGPIAVSDCESWCDGSEERNTQMQ